MSTTQTVYTEFSLEDIQALDVELKVGILGTVNAVGLPHLTMISTLRPYAACGLAWGQFTEGLSKQHIRQNPQVGFLIMSLDKQMWRGKARFTHTARSGPEYDAFNNQPMFRYNAYFGIHTVYYMDLVECYGREPLPMGRIVSAAMQTLAARALGRKMDSPPVINHWTRALLSKLDNLKFIGYVGADGYPLILPVIQAQPLDSARLIISSGAYGDELRNIPPGIPIAVFGLSLSMEDVLLRGEYGGVQRVGGVPCGVVEVNWVYNSMPPKPQQIYPPVPVEAVRDIS
jgi:hypothetical protein